MKLNIKGIIASFPKDGIDRNNTIAVFLMGALPAVGGSAISVILYASLVWAILSLVLGRFEFLLTRSDRTLAWAFTFFAVVIAATAFVGEHSEQAPRKLVWLLGFLSPWVIIPRLRAGSDGNYLAPYILGAAVGAIVALAMAIIQLAVMRIRPEGGAGNAAVFAIMSLCLMGLGTLNIGSGSNRRTILGLAAALCGGLAVFLSQTRGVALVVPFMIPLIAAYVRISRRSGRSWRIVLLTLAVTVLMVLGARQVWETRQNQAVPQFSETNDEDLAISGEPRLQLWMAATEAIAQSPIWGFGIQNRMTVLPRQENSAPFPFSHAHNGFLTFTLDGGILALAALIAMVSAPIVLSLRAPQDGNHRLRLFMALVVTGAYVLCGMTEIMFNHDIMDSFFILFAIVLAASVPDSAPRSR